jgi:hypothetical protein
MPALEPHRLVSVNAMQPSRPLVEPTWLRAAEGVLDAPVFNLDADFAAHATESVVELSTRRTLETASACVTANGAVSTTSIQYP